MEADVGGMVFQVQAGQELSEGRGGKMGVFFFKVFRGRVNILTFDFEHLKAYGRMHVGGVKALNYGD